MQNKKVQIPRIGPKMDAKKREEFLYSAHVLGSAMEVFSVEFQRFFVDSKFNAPAANGHLKQIKTSIAFLRSHLSQFVYPLDKDHLEYEFAVELHRVFSHFCGYPTDKLENFMDLVDKMEPMEEAAP